MKKNKWTLLAIFVALSTAGAFIKVPAIVGSVALDSFPSLIAAALLGGPAGAVVAAFGHLISSFLSGMPLGPFHLIIAGEMAILILMFAWIYQRGKKMIAGLVFLLGNALIAPLPFLFIMGKAFYVMIVPSLLIGSLLNIGLALLAIPRLYPVFKVRWEKR
ncbi:ECF transporter S component [Bacillus sp. 03113]|uniref:ECF transporter S component n=1 Tax=Bacillus sp. 03113 TaxID=2578211 RepID=UPI001142E40B|nr:ECF transporter S component [Bacillus sp. 03113]